jgi:hypothetical protein
VSTPELNDEQRKSFEKDILRVLKKRGPAPSSQALLAKELGHNADSGQLALVLASMSIRGVVRAIGRTSVSWELTDEGRRELDRPAWLCSRARSLVRRTARAQ